MGMGIAQTGGLQRSAAGGSHPSLTPSDNTSQHQPGVSLPTSVPPQSTVDTVSSSSTVAPNVVLPVNSQTAGGIPGISTSSVTSSSQVGGAASGTPPTSTTPSVDTSSQKSGVRQVKLTPLAKPPGLDPMLLMREREAR